MSGPKAVTDRDLPEGEFFRLSADDIKMIGALADVRVDRAGIEPAD